MKGGSFESPFFCEMKTVFDGVAGVIEPKNLGNIFVSIPKLPAPTD